MPLPVAIGLAALSAIPEVLKLGLAGKQKREADELAKLKQPQYDIPQAETEALTRAKYNALKTQIAGYGDITNKIGATTANQIRGIQESAESGSQSIAAGSAAVSQQQNALTDIGIAGQQMYDRNQQSLTGQLERYGQFQDKKWDLNQYQPYLRAKQAESALRYGAEANKYSGMKGIFGAASAGLLYADKTGAFSGSGGNKNWTPPQYSGTDTSNEFNQPSTTVPENYPFPNAFPTAQPLDTPNNMNGQNPQFSEVAKQKFFNQYGRYPTDQEIKSFIF